MSRKARRAPVSRDRRFKQKACTDYGPIERWQHTGRTLWITEQAGVVAARSSEECLLDVLLLKEDIDQRAFDAGMKLRADYHLGRIEPKITGSYSPLRSINSQPSAREERSAGAEKAYARWRKAVQNIGIIHSDIVISACCLDRPPSLTGLTILRQGLEALANWYEL